MNRIFPSLILAAVMIGVGIAIVAARRAGLVGHDASTRAFMAMLGLMVTAYANVIPKRSSPVSRGRLAVRRLAGWTLSLAGLGYAVAWIVAPMAVAPDISAGLILLAVISVIVFCFWGRGARRAA